jgi:hypothetical protein
MATGTVPDVTGHVFISYSHDEAGPYVEQLGAYLTGAGIPVWYDKEIITGHRWAHVIRDRIDTCAAFIIIMTPGADQSDWVNREISQAEQAKRPILPLLLSGTRFFTLANLQYENVNTASMPSAAFVTRLHALLPAPPRQVSVSDDPHSLTGRHRQASSAGEAGDLAEAVRRGRDVVADRTRVLGPDHPDTLATKRQLTRYER